MPDRWSPPCPHGSCGLHLNYVGHGKVLETANVGMELIDDAEAIFLNEVQGNCMESGMIGGEVLEVVDAKSLMFAD
jgi:hypothetical protein